MYYSGIEPCDVLNGEGFRTTIWVSGCEQNCKGCFNPLTHNPTYGKEYTQNTQDYILNCLSKSYIQGLTITGGHPLESYNINTVENLIDSVLGFLPSKDIWLYTAFTWEEIQKNDRLKQIINKCNILVDGRYVESLRDISLKFRGSSNQRLIDIKNSTQDNVKILNI